MPLKRLPDIYRLGIGLRMLLASLYAAVGGLWLSAPADAAWLKAALWLLVLGHAFAATMWLLRPDWRRLTQYSAWLAIFSLPIALLGLAVQHGWQYAALAPMTGLMFLVAGWGSFWRQAPTEGLPKTRGGWLLAFKLALDEAMLGYFVTTASTPARQRVRGIAHEVGKALEIMSGHGWTRAPIEFHDDIRAPERYELEEKGALGHQFHALSFASAYQPDPALPGAQRWRDFEATQTAHARIFEHEDGPRPWLMCIHGYRMGWPYMDFQLFSPGWLHHKLGFNLIMPLLPLHGHRKIGMRSGDGLFDGEILDLLHAEAQAVSDLRSCLYWLRAYREVPRLGVYGISLGGLNASLLSCLEADIDSLIAGIPLVDPVRVIELNGAPHLLRGLRREGIDFDMIGELLAPISPLKMPCRVPPEARAIVAGTQDRILPLRPILQLQAHWDCPLHWYPGTHLSIRREHDVRQWLCTTWGAHGMLDDRHEIATGPGGPYHVPHGK